jgi:UDP-glucose 4-epimerase
MNNIPMNFEKNIQNKTVFITGADGFIGSHLTEACVKAGAKVKALSYYSSFDSDGWLDDLSDEVKADLEIVRGDIRDSDHLRTEISGVDVVFHLAALIAIPHSYSAPQAYVQTNVAGSLNVFIAARDTECEKIIHTSTSEVYGTAQIRPIPENHPLVGQSPYSASKIAADKMAEAMHLSFDMPITTLRPFNTFGPRQSQRAVIPTVVRQSLDDTCAEIRLGDLTPERDFCYVGDTVQAFLAAAGAEAVPGETYNAGSGVIHTIGDMVDIVIAKTETKKEVTIEQARLRPENSEVRALQADFTKFNKATGWSPSETLESGLEKTIEWWRTRSPSAIGQGYRI